MPRSRRQRPRRTAELTAVANLGIASVGSDVASASVTAAEAQVTYAQAVLDNYTLRAPYDALVVARNLQLGAMPVPGPGGVHAGRC